MRPSNFDDATHPNPTMEVSHINWLRTEAAKVGMPSSVFLRQVLGGVIALSAEKPNTVAALLKKAPPTPEPPVKEKPAPKPKKEKAPKAAKPDPAPAPAKKTMMKKADPSPAKRMTKALESVPVKKKKKGLSK